MTEESKQDNTTDLEVEQDEQAPAAEDQEVGEGAKESLFAKVIEKESDANDDSGEDADGGEDAESDLQEQSEPVDYSTLEFPEDVEVDKTALDSFQEMLKGMNDGKGLTLEDAQKIVNFRNELFDQQMQQMENYLSEKRGEIINDKDLGGKNFEKKTVPNITKALEKYATPEFIKEVKSNSMYESLGFFKMLNNIGKSLNEDQMIQQKSISNAPRTLEQVANEVYHTMK